MTETTLEQISRRMNQMLIESARRNTDLHAQFLRARQAGLGDIARLIALQTLGDGAALPSGPAPRPALFDSRALDAFGVGKISGCFGPDFARYDTRRIPRIPNGDLKMMSRVVEIQGERFTGKPHAAPAAEASIVVEYDVPVDAWYLRDNASPHMPASLWMETALQPCGFLSAYLDTYSLVPYGAFMFRNLDGFARLGAPVDVRGQTITTRARMITSVVSSGAVIQKFAFELTCAGQPVYAGESSFGYFSIETMANQVGLDGGRKTQPWWRSENAPVTPFDTRPYRHPGRSGSPHLASGQLGFLENVQVSSTGGAFGLGYVYAARPVNPQDWFYPCHFYQDPVMPGSLGVEAMFEALQAFALSQRLDAGLRAPRFGLAAAEPPMTWRYRGQITPQHQNMELEVHLSGLEKQPGRILLHGNANLWVDGLRIYEVKNITVGLLEGN